MPRRFGRVGLTNVHSPQNECVSDASSNCGREGPSAYFKPNTHPQPPTVPQPQPLTEEQQPEQHPRDLLPELCPSRKPGTQWFYYDQINRQITKLIKADYDRPCYNWSSTHIEVKKRWWKAFTQLYKWNPKVDNMVKKEFENAAKKRLKAIISDCKAKREKRGKPLWISEEVWKSMCELWDTPSHKKKCEKASACRKSDRNGKGMSAHTAGTKSFAAVFEELEKEKGKKPSYFELLMKTHRRADGTWVDNRAKEIYESSRKANEEISSFPKNDIFDEMVMPSKGLGSVPAVSVGSSDSLKDVELENQRLLIEKQKQEIENNKQKMEKQNAEFESFKQWTNERLQQLFSMLDKRNGGTANRGI